jgi:uncharacterized protein
MREFVIHLQDLAEDGKDYDLPIRPEWLTEMLQDAQLKSDPSAGPGRLTMHVQRNGQDVLVQGRVEARLIATCGRCLGDVSLGVATPLAVLFSARPDRPEPTEQDLTPEDLDREYFSGPQIVLDEVVRDHLVLEVPMQPVCDPDCSPLQIPEGVKPPAEAFDKRSRVDPRLAGLKDLAAKLPRDKE